MPKNTQKIVIGRFGKTHGVQGWIRVISFTDPPINILSYQDWQLETSLTYLPLTIEGTKLQGEYLLVKMSGYDNPEDAHQLTNCLITINRNQLPKLEPEEYYCSDLIGLEVVNYDGTTLGRVEQVIATGSNDVLIIRGEQELWLPYTTDMIQAVDLKTQKILVNWQGYA